MAFDASCPLCNEAAKFEPLGFPAPSRYYLCTCGEFVIDDAGESTVAGYTPAFRQRLAAAAKLIFGDYVCVISVTKNDGRVDVDCNPVLRSEALR